MVDMEQAWLLPALPAAAFVILALFHQYLPRKGNLIAVGSTVPPFLLAPLLVSARSAPVLPRPRGPVRWEPRYGFSSAAPSSSHPPTLTRVLADDCLLLYVTWEGVGI